jgi:DNA polymerase III subunit delta'
MIYPWQQDDWQRLQQFRTRLPHAILLHGQEGSGKVGFAENFAKSILCERPTMEAFACGECEACGWFSQYSHPDYRRVRPEILDAEDAESSVESEEESGTKKTATTRNPSKEIRIEQIRGLATFMNVSTHRAGLRVILLYPAEALNGASANALLKTLEEPPPNSLFLLVSHRYDRLLPTIRSRCQSFALGLPDSKAATHWLEQQGLSDADKWLAEQGGAPLTALLAAQSDDEQGHEELLTQFTRPDRAKALVVAERLQKVPLTSLVSCQQRWLYDLFLIKLTGKVRYYPRHATSLLSLAKQIPLYRLQQALRDAGERRAISDHSLSARLFIENMLLDYVRLFSPEAAT